jgi:hypothetical protein
LPNRAQDWCPQALVDIDVADAEGAPHDHYGPLQSEEAIRYAREILAFVRAQMAGPAER